MDDTRLSKRLSYVLRHDPASIGVALDAAGWADLDPVVAGLRASGADVDAQRLVRLVVASDAQRFELDRERGRIRARYGHSVDVDPSHTVTVPPPVLYHGTPVGTVERILAEGLRPMGRRKVHLSTDVTTATAVGGRRGRPVVLEVDAAGMHRDGRRFQRATATTWLVDAVPPAYLCRHSDVGPAS